MREKKNKNREISKNKNKKSKIKTGLVFSSMERKILKNISWDFVYREVL